MKRAGQGITKKRRVYQDNGLVRETNQEIVDKRLPMFCQGLCERFTLLRQLSTG
jgi:hypothetical protein